MSSFRWSLLISLLVSLLMTTIGHAQTAPPRTITVILKSGMEATGILEGEDDSSYILWTNLGQLRVAKDQVKAVFEVPSMGRAAGLADTTSTHDQVVVYLKDGKTIDGILVAKSRGRIVVYSTDGRITIPKGNIDRIEYLGAAYAEQGERVRIELVNGRRYEGRIEREDAATMTLGTSFGTIDIDKAQLYSLQYLAAPEYRPGEAVGEPADAAARAARRNLREESWMFGYSRDFGSDYNGGLAISYARWRLIRARETLTIHGSGGLGFSWYGLSDAVKDQEVPGGVDAKGRALLFSLDFGLPLTFHPADVGLYRFHIVPSIAGVVVSKRLELAFPSFPSNNIDESSTKLRFGAGLDFLFDFALGGEYSVGFGFRQRYLAGDDPNYNDIVVYFARQKGLFDIPWP